MSTRPHAALVMWPGVEEMVITPPVRAALAELVTLIDDAPIDVMAAPLADLESVEVLIGGWGCAPLDAAALDRLPALRLLAYAAGTVKGVVTDELWARGVTMSSAAAANAEPVAEFTFAAIIMIAKDVFRVRDAYRTNRGEGWVSGVGPAGPLGTHGLKVGVIGASKIGRLVLERLRSLDVEVALRDPYIEPEQSTSSLSAICLRGVVSGGCNAAITTTGAASRWASTSCAVGPTLSPCTRPSCPPPAT